MRLPDPGPEVVAAVDGAVAWLESAALHDTTEVFVTDAQGRRDRILAPKPGARIWARFYDLEDGRPIYIGRDSITHRPDAHNAPAGEDHGLARLAPGETSSFAMRIRETAATLITRLTQGEIDQARAFLADGMARGTGARSVALDLVGRISRATGNREGGLIGLSGPYRDYVATARAELASTDPALLRNYLSRNQRDRRYDRAVARAIETGKPVPPETARTAVTRYSARLVRLRGEVIARTEGLPAIRAAKHEAYQQLADDGRVDVMDIVRGWSTNEDGRQRDTHDAMNGQEVRGLDIPFTSPSGAQMMYPGDTSRGAPASETVACRCDEYIAIKARKA